MLWRNPRDLGDYVLDLGHLDALGPLLFGLQALVGTRLVDHVDGLVGHMPIVDVARCQLRCGTQGLIAVLDMVVLLEARLEPPEDAYGVLDRRFGDIDLLEAPSESPVLLENAAELLEGSRADAADLTRRQQRLEQVRCIHHTARGSPGTDDGVDLIDEENGVGALAQLVEQRLEALLEVAAVLGAGQQRTEIQGIDHTVSQQVRHLAIDDTFGQAFGDGGLAHAGFTHQ
ncbi:hypothetical protein D3C85_404060 [compost metagenome]